MTCRSLSAVLLALSITGCTLAGKNIYVASDTTLGVIGAMNTAHSSGKLIIGYDRQFIAVVPKKESSGENRSNPPANPPNDGTGATNPDVAKAEISNSPPTRSGDAMSAFNCTHLEIKGITVTKFYERLATGPAAVALVSHLPPAPNGSNCATTTISTGDKK